MSQPSPETTPRNSVRTTASRTAADTAAGRTAAEITDRLERILADPAGHGLLGEIPGSALSLSALTPAGERVELLSGSTSAGFRPDGTDGHPEVPITARTRFDLASISKLFVSVAALSVVDSGLIDLDAPVRELLSVGRGAGAEQITLRQLLTHSSGLPATTTAWESISDPDALLAHVLETPLARAPGAGHEYSCLGYVAIGRALEIATGHGLEAIMRERVLEPLGTERAGYGPVAPERSVATEIQPHRGLVWGEVHDELCFGLGRVVGNSGLFAPARDALRLAEMILEDGRGSRGRVLTTESVALLGTPHIRAANAAGEFAQGVGFRIGDAEFMGAVPGLGHTGFTGTMLLVNRENGSAAALLTNRVHPGRARSNVFPLQRAVAELACL